jgi:hypothetical protein
LPNGIDRDYIRWLYTAMTQPRINYIWSVLKMSFVE